MSDILKMTEGLARDLAEVGAMDRVTLREVEALCLPPTPTLTAADVRRIRAGTRMSQPVFAAVVGVGRQTVAQWEQGNRTPSGPSARLLDLIDRKGVGAVV